MPLKPHPTDPDKMVYVSPHYDLPYTPTASPVATPRPWVGLTDEEIGQLAATHLFRDVWPHSTFAAIHAIEAKLKEKNS